MQPLACGVIWYVTVSTLNPELTRVWFRMVPGTTLLLNPDIFPELGVHVQENKVEATFEVSVRFVEPLLHKDLLRGVFVRSGVGHTVTIYVATSPSHPFACGVIW